MPSKEAARESRKKENNRAYYEAHRESILSERKDKYSSECRSQRHANEYYKNVTASREKSAEATKTSFNKDLAKSRIESAERQREYYHQDLEKSRTEVAKKKREHYHQDLEKSRVDSAESTKEHYRKDVAKSHAATRSSTSKYYSNIEKLCKESKHRYLLKPPTESQMHSCVDSMIEGLLQQKETCSAIVNRFTKLFYSIVDEMSLTTRKKTACRIVSRKLMHEALSTRKTSVGVLLRSLRKISGIQLVSEDDLEIQLHSSASEPYYYETAYKFSAPEEVTIVDHDNRCLVTRSKSSDPQECPLYSTVIPVDERGRCVLAEEVGTGRTSDDRPKSWRCSELCKQLTDEEMDEILQIKLAFERPLEEVNHGH
ncbi:uncharacterized protein [Dysidea avara]|uniref:uncharacterized protein n=1 Tax=Dysidea avara TaxID=196820 RepID=UPI00331B2CBE